MRHVLQRARVILEYYSTHVYTALNHWSLHQFHISSAFSRINGAAHIHTMAVASNHALG